MRLIWKDDDAGTDDDGGSARREVNSLSVSD